MNICVKLNPNMTIYVNDPPIYGVLMVTIVMPHF